jgi:ELWxxDGT repeat protein
MFLPELLETRQLLSVTPVLVVDLNETAAADLDAPEAPIFGGVDGATVFVEYSGDGSSRLVRVSPDFAERQILREFSQRTDLVGTSFTDRRGVLYFRAVDSLTGDELWKTDGTAAGTERIWSQGQQSGPDDQSSELTEFDQKKVVGTHGSLFFFNVGDSALTHRRQLWQSDGTVPGTIPVTSAAGLEIDFSTIAAHHGAVVYAADGFNGAGVEPWLTGETGASGMIADIHPGPASSFPHEFQSVSGSLLFAADDGVHGTELWIDIGTTQWMVMDINPGAGGSFPQILATADEETYFTADDGVTGRELWWYIMGPQAFLVSDLNPGPADSAITSGAFLNRRDASGYRTFLFNGTNGTTGKALWATSSQDEPVQLTFNRPDGGGHPEYLTNVGDTVYFSAYEIGTGRDLWRSDGTPQGTRIAGGFEANSSYNSDPRNLQAVNDGLFFVADQKLHQLVSNVYTVAGNEQVAVSRYFSGTLSSQPEAFYGAGSGVEFRTTGGARGTDQFWFTDGSRFGTEWMIDDLDSTYHLIGSNGLAAFYELRLNGSSILASTGPMDLSFLTAGRPLGFQQMGSLAVFLAQAPDAALTLWVSDGTVSGSHSIRRLNSSSLPLTFVASSASATHCYFLTRNSLGVYELWKTDGTVPGTISVSLSDIAPDFTYESGLFASDDVVYFSAAQPHTGVELWQSDGTIVGTVLVSDTIPGPVGGTPEKGIAFRGGMVFSGMATEDGGTALWFSDGTSVGTTRLLENFSSAAMHSSIDNLLAIGDLVYFTMATDHSGTELWKTDGTPAGTTLLKDLLPGTLSSLPQSMTEIDGQLMLTALDSQGVRQIWTSDGTTDGTIALTSEDTGVAVHPETDFALTPNGVLFTGATPQTGWELYSLPIDVPPAPTISTSFSDDGGVSVEWSDVENAIRYEVWISNLSDPSFVPEQVLTTDLSWKVPAELPVGAYQVWVRSYSLLQEPSVWSVPQNFVVGDDPVMHALPHRSPEDLPTFAWTGPDDADSYELWLTNRDSKVRTLYISGLATTTYAMPDELDPAKYAVWVRATNNDGSLSDWSTLTEFEVQAPPVVLISGAGETLDSRPTLVWQAVAGATGYDVRIIPVGSSVPAYQINNVSGATHVPTRDLPAGRFDVFIRAVLGTRPFSAWGVGDRLIVKLPPAGLRTTGVLIAADTGLAWNPVPSATSYTLEILDAATGARVMPDPTVTGTVFIPTTPFGTGRYLVRVRSNFDAGQPSKWSATLAFQLYRSAVAITSSNAATADATPVITWSAAPGASSYEIYISRQGASAAVYQRTGILGTTHRVEIPLTSGSHQIWVRGHLPDGSRTVWSSAQNLMIGPAPVITRTTSGFTWAPINAATHYELWLNYLGPNTPVQKIVYDSFWTTTNIAFPTTLPKGTYQLWLRAIRGESGQLYYGAWSTSGPFSL